MGEGELQQAEGLGLAARPAAAGRGEGLEQVGEGHADVDAARAVLVVLAVAVVVDALAVEHVEALLALGRIRLAHEPGLALDGDPLAGRVLDAHLR